MSFGKAASFGIRYLVGIVDVSFGGLRPMKGYCSRSINLSADYFGRLSIPASQ